MSDTEKASTTPNGKGWTDRQRLAYYFSLVEHSNVKLDFLTAPRPSGKTVGACRIMVDRLKGTLKADLAALRGEADNEGQGHDAAGDKTKAKVKKPVTPRKRKSKGDAAGEGEEVTPTKRGRKKKSEEKQVVAAEEVVQVEGGVEVKDEVGDGE
ncbi:hypothetical protein CFE70_000412 [Pyrenophora teres f. teres 0-1]|uniref:Uncharacterized protein n=2 Tax=Pyrenophora teres f. teres TaxID=97479 RepID=E3RGZ3_PYRTT|nr:hypothetical protein PTT_07130 [Pyrenophora teres f. teres 0-1]KAE8836325.1 hypothetical protein HRS9139_04423 [Pyrenophora teres f. teres]KAE8837704.1 hypothetical protein PTNB85_05039 [Pyrenophora teres f. teres]KAE8839876.1 hypothetical protein HRS9122_06481 [Pyrenophora teres f. teres]KAE8862527.1 hypothetical protein PTNB29_05089 [Pyrenophora teres f. teres]